MAACPRPASPRDYALPRGATQTTLRPEPELNQNLKDLLWSPLTKTLRNNLSRPGTHPLFGMGTETGTAAAPVSVRIWQPRGPGRTAALTFRASLSHYFLGKIRTASIGASKDGEEGHPLSFNLKT